MGLALNITEEFITETCITCGITFAFPATRQRWLKQDHQNFYCPNGHAQHYPAKSDAEKLREQLVEKERQLGIEQRNRLALEQQNAQLMRRAKNGTCPCCKRTFSNMARHMQSKHPEFGKKKK